MIAPSPDWIVGINSISLLNSEGNWIEEIVIDLYPYDAGTDSGLDYSSPNMDTDPQDPISSLQGVMPFSTAPMGTLTISLEGILSVDELALENVSLSPNPATDLLMLQFPQAEFDRVAIYSALGQQVIARRIVGQQDLELDISELKSGVYLVHLQSTQGQTVVRKLVKR